MKALLIGLMLVGGCQAAEVYRWQDDQGRWYYGDAAHSASVKAASPVDEANLREGSANFIKTRVISPRVARAEKTRTRTVPARKSTPVLTMREKKEQCDKIRDELRLQPFRYAERDRYDHECVSGIKW